MKRLYRSRKDRKIVGVCGGIAAYLNIDSTVVRVIAIILMVPGLVPGLIGYGFMWAIMPEES